MPHHDCHEFVSIVTAGIIVRVHNIFTRWLTAIAIMAHSYCNQTPNAELVRETMMTKQLVRGKFRGDK